MFILGNRRKNNIYYIYCFLNLKSITYNVISLSEESNWG